MTSVLRQAVELFHNQKTVHQVKQMELDNDFTLKQDSKCWKYESTYRVFTWLNSKPGSLHHQLFDPGNRKLPAFGTAVGWGSRSWGLLNTPRIQRLAITINNQKSIKQATYWKRGNQNPFLQMHLNRIAIGLVVVMYRVKQIQAFQNGA